MIVNGDRNGIRSSAAVAALIAALTASLAGCGSVSQQVISDGHSTEYDLPLGAISSEGLALITPSAATGQETNRHALALGFADVIHERYPEANVVTLPQLLSAVNRSGLAAEYSRMFNDYEATGILERDALQAIASACSVRYIGHLDLARFEQSYNKRLGLFGLRIVDTKQATIRVFFQIWDAETGNIAWEGSEELALAYETAREKPVTFTMATEEAANRMLDRFPRGPRSDESRHLDLAAVSYAPTLSE